MINNSTQFISNSGCLQRYLKVASWLDPKIIQQIILLANQQKGFLCNFQIPLMFIFATQARGKMVEIGCWFGRTTTVLLAGSENDLKLYCVDTFRGSDEHQEELKGYYYRGDFEKNVSQFFGRYEIREGFSHEISTQFEDRWFDYIWIDASHDYFNVKRDIESWFPKLKSGGLMLGHDYPEPTDPNGGFQDLTRAVNETVRDSSYFRNFGWVCGIWGAEKI